MVATNVKLVDSAATPNEVELVCLRIGGSAVRETKDHQRPSTTTQGEKNEIIIDAFQVERIWTLEVEFTDAQDYKDAEELITKTMPKNYPMKMYLGTKPGPAGGYVKNGTNVLPSKFDTRMDFEGHGGVSRFMTTITLLEGAHVTIKG